MKDPIPMFSTAAIPKKKSRLAYVPRIQKGKTSKEKKVVSLVSDQTFVLHFLRNRQWTFRSALKLLCV